MNNSIMIRAGKETDLEALTEIYNYAVLHTTATFDLHPKTVAERREWFMEHTGKHLLLVSLKGDAVTGYATLSSYRPKEAYDSTVELSVYVHADYQRQGVGKALMDAILKEARQIKTLHTVVSVITAGNAASDRLHRAFGFEHCGRVREAGRKFGQYLDIDTYQLMLE